MDLWNFNVDVSELYKRYHYSSINDEILTTVQIYIPPIKQNEKKDNKIFSDVLTYRMNKDSEFENVVYNRHSWPREFINDNIINFEFISKFIQIAFIGGDKTGRNYPAGGAQYMVNTFLLFNENKVEGSLISKGNVCKIDFDLKSLEYIKTLSWNEIEDAFIQKECVNTAQFAIVLSVNLDTINKKYFDIAYKIAQQEAGHIGENIQLISQYMNLKSLPLGGFYDIKINKIIENSQTALYCFLVG